MSGALASILACGTMVRPVTAAGGACVTEAEPARVERITRWRELALADGRLLRLPWLDVPAPTQEAVTTALNGLVGQYVLVQVAASADRWNRIAAQVATMAPDGGPEAELAVLLVERGHARLRPEPGGRPSAPCLTALRRAETTARNGKLGLWGADSSRVHDAAAVAELHALSGGFIVIEGRPTSVGERKSFTFINFGTDWNQDTTVTVPKPIWRILVDRGMSASVMRQRRIRVRGIAQERGGPLIEVTAADDIELVGMEETR